MAQLIIDTNKGTADSLKSGATKINSNFTELYSILATDQIPIPSLLGNSGKYLTTDGTTVSWGTVVGGAGTVPNAVVTIIGDKILWNDERTQPTEEEIAQKIAELEYTEEVESYKEVRAKAYPVMSEQLDKIFHEGIDAWKAVITAVKERYPKS